MLKKGVVFLIFWLFSTTLFPQINVRVGDWKDHLSFNSCNAITKAGDIVYVSNGTGLTKYNTTDNSIESLNKINGLSDIGISLLRYNPYNGAVLVIYNNANIDIIKGNTITNFSDIKLKTITGKKDINEVTFKNNLAFLACGFGIVVFDTEKLEVRDTYVIGPLGSYINVYQVELTDTTIFAAADGGLYKANLSTVLNDFQNWKTVSAVPTGTYNAVVKFNNRIIANYSPFAGNGTTYKDSLYRYDGTTWKRDTIKKLSPGSGSYSIRKMRTVGSYFTLIDQFGYEVYDQTENRIAYITQYFSWAGGSNIGDVALDYPNYWIADKNYGFIKSAGPYPFYPNEKINISGTHSNFVGSIFIKDGKVLSAPIKMDVTGVAFYSKEGLNYFDGTTWQYYKSFNADTIFDYNHAIIDKNDPSHFWASSWIQGLVEFKNGNVVNVYNSNNAGIPALSCCAGWHRVAGLAQDKDGNLWIGSSDVSNFLTVRKTDGTFINLGINAQPPPFVGNVMVDKNNQIWVAFPRGNGLAVVKNNNFQSFQIAYMNTAQGSGKLPDLTVSAFAEDKDGQVWVGTAKGVTVFYNPENIFTGGNYDSQQIKITQDGHVQILLETEKVTAIAVDGANRKWIGTEASGVYCFSPDGQTQIYHFDKESSPLFSNQVNDIAYDDVNGDVYIGTEQGIQSFRTAIVKGEEEFKEVHAYPNPVKPGYTGNVYVRGLIDEAIVKITDLSGNLVWETKSLGGQIEWPLTNLSGKKVSSGVYLATCAASDGSSSAVAKILVLN